MRLERHSETMTTPPAVGERLTKTRYRTKNAVRALRCWYFPYLKSRYYSGEFRPLLSYLYTEWKCNINCYYC
ncbi:MAG TPA: hypothetical protein VNK06_07855, partial [Thermodesulfobacteriota bacterium]|nr:hypothetical protein [Thermodesulfobacteriota bacterium]